MTVLDWKSEEKYRGRAVYGRLLAALIAMAMLSAAVLIFVHDPKAWSASILLFFSIWSLLCACLIVGAVVGEACHLQQISVSEAGIDVVTWTSNCLGGKFRRVEIHIVPKGVMSIGVIEDSETSGVNACVRVLPASPICGNRVVILEYAESSVAATFAEGARALLNLDTPM